MFAGMLKRFEDSASRPRDGAKWPLAVLSILLLLAVLLDAPLPIVLLAVMACGGAAGWILAQAQTQSASTVKAVRSMPAIEIAQLVRVMELPAIVIDDTRRILAHNRYASDVFQGLTDGQPLATVSRNPDLKRAVEYAITHGRAESAEMTERLLHGRSLLVTATPIGDGSQVLLQFRDTSEQARLAQSRSDFIANASHELRTPLASIKGFIETLQGPARDDAGARTRFLSIMEAQAGRMNRILDDLLSLSRIEMRAHMPPEGIVDLAEIARQALHGLEPLAGEVKITLALEHSDDTYTVRGDRDELEQVVQNLVHNAIKYGRAGGHVTVKLAKRPTRGKAPPQVLLTVADDGPGIPPEHLPRLTERFYRVDTARSRERGGTGLGLAIVKHILNRHRGELDIESEVGRGSTFTVVLDAIR